MLLAANWIRELDTSFVGQNAKDIANSIEQVAAREMEASDSPYFSDAWFRWALVTSPKDSVNEIEDDFIYQFAVLLDTQRPATGERREQALQNFESREGRLIGHVREQFGNPFRPVPFSPTWQTDSTVTLASQMYESRDFGAMPILADALQDAGCDNADILDHCRGDGPHVRGCWVVDLVLGRE